MKEMGPIEEGTLIYILFKAVKDSTTNFYVEVLIDTEEVIEAGAASNYMFDGRDQGESLDDHNFYYYTWDSQNW